MDATPTTPSAARWIEAKLGIETVRSCRIPRLGEPSGESASSSLETTSEFLARTGSAVMAHHPIPLGSDAQTTPETGITTNPSCREGCGWAAGVDCIAETGSCRADEGDGWMSFLTLPRARFRLSRSVMYAIGHQRGWLVGADPGAALVIAGLTLHEGHEAWAGGPDAR